MLSVWKAVVDVFAYTTTRSNFLQRVVDIVKLSEMFYYTLPERPMNDLQLLRVVVMYCLQRVAVYASTFTTAFHI